MTDRRILIDTGPLAALFTATDQHHRLCADTFAGLAPPLLTCWPVLTEAAWIMRKLPRPMDKLAQAYAGGIIDILPLDGKSMGEIAAIMARYESAGVQLADAALAHLADREGIRTIFTTDRRDFSIIRLRRNRTLKLIPDLQ